MARKDGQMTQDTLTIPPVEKWPADLRYLYEERWAIMHFDGGMNEVAAKDAALREIWQLRPR